MSGWGEAGQRINRWRVLAKVLITAMVGGVAYLLTSLAHQSQISAVTLAAFIGGVVLVVQFLIDFDQRLANVENGQIRQSAEMHAVVNEKFIEVSRATELFGQIEASALGADVDRLIRYSIGLDGSAPRLALDLARSQIERVSQLLHQLGGGIEAVYDDGEDRDWLLALTRNTRSTIDATSRGVAGPDGRFVDEGLWLTELGQRYLEAQQAAIREGVTIRRVFLLDRPELADDPVFGAIRRQQEAIGINVRVIGLGEIPGTGRSFVSDLIVFDDVISYESTASRAAGMAPMYVKTTLILEPDRVKRRIRRFNDIWDGAREH
jgi:hypothetical protein